jgi:hypothetical protein
LSWRGLCKRFADLSATELGSSLQEVYDFRNEYVAHSKDELDNATLAEDALRQWIDMIRRLGDPSLQLLATA